MTEPLHPAKEISRKAFQSWPNGGKKMTGPTHEEQVAALIDTIVSGEQAALKYGPMSALYEHNQKCLCAVLARMESRHFECEARKSSIPEPQDCDWPVCGCDPYADKVMSALEESRAFIPMPPVADLTMMLRRMIYKIGKKSSETSLAHLANEASDLLNRHGLEGNILRSPPSDTSSSGGEG